MKDLFERIESGELEEAKSGLFSADYFHDMLSSEIASYLGSKDKDLLSKSEFASMEKALAKAVSAMKKDYVK